MKGSRFNSWAKASGFIRELYAQVAWATSFAAEPGQGHDTKAAEWRAKLEVEATKPRSHEGTKGRRDEGKRRAVGSAVRTKRTSDKIYKMNKIMLIL